MPSFVAQRSSMNLERQWYLYDFEDSFKMACFIYLIQTEKGIYCPKWCWINTHRYTNILFKNNNHEAFIYERKHIIDMSFFSEASFSSSFRSPIERCFRKTNAFSDFRYKGKINNVWKHFYHEYRLDNFIWGTKVKSWSRISFILDIDFI